MQFNTPRHVYLEEVPQDRPRSVDPKAVQDRAHHVHGQRAERRNDHGDEQPVQGELIQR